MQPNIYNFFQFLQNKIGLEIPFDLKIKNSTPEQIKQMYHDNPELFQKRRYKKLLQQIGVENVSGGDMWFEMSMDASEIRRLVDGDYVVRNYTNAQGVKKQSWFFETLLSGDYWDLFDYGGGDWKLALEYYADEENKDIIWDLIKGITNPDEIEGLSLVNAIEEYDTDYEIRNALGNAMSATESDSTYKYCYNTLKNCLEEYGEVLQLNDEGVRIKINLEKVIEDTNTDEDDVDEIFERCDDELECVFFELLGTYYDKPHYSTDDRWTPDVNERDFNDTLNSYLGDIRM